MQTLFLTPMLLIFGSLGDTDRGFTITIERVYYTIVGIVIGVAAAYLLDRWDQRDAMGDATGSAISGAARSRGVTDLRPHSGAGLVRVRGSRRGDAAGVGSRDAGPKDKRSPQSVVGLGFRLTRIAADPEPLGSAVSSRCQ